MAVMKEAADSISVRPCQSKRVTARVQASANLPRTVLYSNPRKRMVKPGATGSPRAILQQEVTNSQTGKRAVGPWLGPFSAASKELGNPADALIPSTIYMDSNGSCHLDLDPAGDRRMSQQLYKAQSDSGLLAEVTDQIASQQANQLMELTRDVHQQARAVQAHSLFSHAALDKTPVAKNVMKRMHVINQPRRFN